MTEDFDVEWASDGLGGCQMARRAAVKMDIGQVDAESVLFKEGGTVAKGESLSRSQSWLSSYPYGSHPPRTRRKSTSAYALPPSACPCLVQSHTHCLDTSTPSYPQQRMQLEQGTGSGAVLVCLEQHL